MLEFGITQKQLDEHIYLEFVPDHNYFLFKYSRNNPIRVIIYIPMSIVL